MNGYEKDQRRADTAAALGYAQSAMVQGGANAAPASAVSSAQASLDSNIRTLHEALGALQDRLQPVLIVLPPDAGKNATGQIKPVATSVVATSVSQRIHESSDSVNYAIARVTSLLDRLEI